MNRSATSQPRPPAPDRDTLKESEGVVAMFRTLLIAMALLVPAVVDGQPRPTMSFYLVGTLAALYSILTTVMVWKGVRWRFTRHVTLVVDILLLTLLIEHSGGFYGGGLFPLYYLTVIIGAIWFSVTGAIASAALATVACAVALAVTAPHSTVLYDLRDLVFPRAMLLFLAAILCAYLSEAWRAERAEADYQRSIVEQFRQQIDMAQELQNLILPSSLPPAAGLDLGVRTRQAAVVVGGDYYDAVAFSDGAYGLCCADVSGKSVPGQLRLPLVKYAFRVCARHYRAPDRVLAQLARVLYDELPPEMFVSMVYVLIEPDRGKFSLARAGHCPPLHWLAATGEVRELNPKGVVLGVERYLTYEVTELPFAPDDYLLLYSDGVIEAADKHGNMLETEGLIKLVGEATPESAQDLANALFRDLGEHESGAKRDDLTLVVLRRAPEGRV